MPLSLKALKAKHDARRAAGRCPRCNARPRAGRVLCAACALLSQATNARRTMRLLRAGVCIRCASRPPMTRRQQCFACLKDGAGRRAARRRVENDNPFSNSPMRADP